MGVPQEGETMASVKNKNKLSAITDMMSVPERM